MNEYDLVKAMQTAAVRATNADKPVKVEVGTVVSASPIKVQVSQNITLSKMQLIIPQHLTDYEVEVTVEWETEKETTNHKHNVNGSVSEGGTFNVDSSEQSEPHMHKIKGKKKIKVHNALTNGDKVILIRQDGGQKYVVLDKVVS